MIEANAPLTAPTDPPATNPPVTAVPDPADVIVMRMEAGAQIQFLFGDC